jgi:hypothetical protein
MSNRSGEAGFGDDDRLPWLETVEEDYREGPSLGRILLLIVLGLAVVAAVLFGFWWYQKQQGLSGNGQLIAAQEGDYKVPDNEAGMNVEGVGSAAYSAGEGTAGNSSVSETSIEAPVSGTVVATPTPSASGASKVAVAAPASGGRLEAKAPVIASVPAAPAVNSGSGSLIQIGAFPDQGGADAAWARITRKVPSVASLGKSVEKGEKNGTILYRLRVNTGSNGQAKEICAKLKAAGEPCYIAN